MNMGDLQNHFIFLFYFSSVVVVFVIVFVLNKIPILSLHNYKFQEI